MNNIEKFEQVKELARLKSEYHKMMLLDLLTFSDGMQDTPKNEADIVDIALTGITLYKQLMEVTKKQEDANC